MLLLTGVLAIVVGLSLGLLGGGGAILAVPLFSVVAGADAHTAVASSLVVVGVTSALAATLHARAGNVSWRAATTFAAAGIAGAYAGGRASGLVPGALLLGAFALVMLVVAVRMWRASPAKTSPRDEAAGADAASPAPRTWRLVIVALFAGALTGLVGAGGGFIVVPALALFGGLPMRRAIGTSLVVIAAQAAAGLAGKVAGGAHVALGATAVITCGALAGAVAGFAISRRVSAQKLQKGFAALIMVMALVMVAQAVRG